MNTLRSFNRWIRKAGSREGVQYELVQPVYTDNTGTENVIVANQNFRCSNGSKRYAEPSVAGGNFYSIYGQYTIMGPGQVLIPADPNQNIVTVEQLFDHKVCIGFETNLTATIAMRGDGYKPVYQNVRFAFINDNSLTTALNQALSSPGTRLAKALIFARTGITTKMWFIQTDDQSGLPVRWTIQSYTQHKNLLVLNLKADQE